MSKRNDFLLLQDILSASEKILSYTKEIDFDGFLQNQIVQDACIRNFEIIGEASNRISFELRSENPKIEWRKISNYRNLLIHEYFGVNLEIVWDVIKNDVVPLKNEIRRLI